MHFASSVHHEAPLELLVERDRRLLQLVFMLLEQHLLGDGKLRDTKVIIAWLDLLGLLVLGPVQNLIEDAHERTEVLQHVVVLLLARFLDVEVKRWLDREQPDDEADYLAIGILNLRKVHWLVQILEADQADDFTECLLEIAHHFLHLFRFDAGVPFNHFQFEEFEKTVDYLVHRGMLITIHLLHPGLSQIAQGADALCDEAFGQLAWQLKGIKIKKFWS